MSKFSPEEIEALRAAGLVQTTRIEPSRNNVTLVESIPCFLVCARYGPEGISDEGMHLFNTRPEAEEKINELAKDDPRVGKYYEYIIKELFMGTVINRYA